MHELGIVQEILDVVAERAAREGASRVVRVVVEVGALAAVLPDAMRFCFDLASQDTVAEGATLEVVEVPGRARCRACDGAVTLERAFGRCRCGCSDLEWLSGEELRITELEVA